MPWAHDCLPLLGLPSALVFCPGLDQCCLPHFFNVSHTSSEKINSATKKGRIEQARYADGSPGGMGGWPGGVGGWLRVGALQHPPLTSHHGKHGQGLACTVAMGRFGVVYWFNLISTIIFIMICIYNFLFSTLFPKSATIIIITITFVVIMDITMTIVIIIIMMMIRTIIIFVIVVSLLLLLLL